MVRTRRNEIIRCPCSVQKDATLIQCEQCLVWQHYDCIGLETEPQNYYCEECRPDNHPFWLKLDETVQVVKIRELSRQEMLHRIKVMELHFKLNNYNMKTNTIEWELFDKELKGSRSETESMVYSAIRRFKLRT